LILLKKSRFTQGGLDLGVSPSLRDILFFLFTQRRRAAKPQSDFFLCGFPAWRDLFFSSREGAKPAYGRVTSFGRSSFFVHAKTQSRKGAKGFLSSLATPLLCEIFFFVHAKAQSSKAAKG